MGEAKRRKQKDPCWGKRVIKIVESTLTNNFLITVSGLTLDSCLSFTEAESIKKWYENEFLYRPLKTINPKTIMEWLLSSPNLENYPDSKAEILTLDRETLSVVSSEVLDFPGKETADCFKSAFKGR